MATNRLLENAPKKAGKVTEQSLRDYAARLNTERWVIASGKHYFVNTRDGPGGVVHFLDREGSA